MKSQSEYRFQAPHIYHMVVLISLDDPSRQEKVTKRASNVLKLTKENEKLQAELNAMAERLEAVERRRAQLAEKEQREGKQPS